jgi:hypothetical protein
MVRRERADPAPRSFFGTIYVSTSCAMIAPEAAERIDGKIA